MNNQPRGNPFAHIPSDRVKLLNALMNLRDLRPEIVSPIEVTLHSGSVLVGELVGFKDNVLTLRHPDAKLKDFVTLSRESDVSTVGVSWTPEVARFLVPRGLRTEASPVGALAVNQQLTSLQQKLPPELKIELKTKEAWSGASEEDLLILEDLIILLARELLNLRKDFASEVDSLKAMVFKQPKGDLMLSGSPGTLEVQLPFESQSVLELRKTLREQLNNGMEQVSVKN